MDEWYYANGNEQAGPVSEDRLKQLFSSGQLQLSNLIWKEGMADWAAASTLPAFRPSTPPNLPRTAATTQVKLRVFCPGESGIEKGMSTYFGLFGLMKYMQKVYVDGRLVGEALRKDGFDFDIDLTSGTHILEVVLWEKGEKGRKKFPLSLNSPGRYEIRFNNAETIDKSTIDMLQQP